MTTSCTPVSTSSSTLSGNVSGTTTSSPISLVTSSHTTSLGTVSLTTNSAMTVTTSLSSQATCAPKSTAAGTLIPNRIFVGGIPINTTEQDLRNFFSTYGPVKDVKVITDRSGLSKGSYGFVTFENQKVAEKLIRSEGDSIIFKDRKLNIGQAIRKQQSNMKPELPGAFLLPSGAIPYPLQNNFALLQLPGQENLASQSILSPYATALMVDPGMYGSLHQSNVSANSQQHQLLASTLVNNNAAISNSTQNHPYLQALSSSAAGGAISIPGISDSPLISDSTALNGSSTLSQLQYMSSLPANHGSINSKHALQHAIPGLGQALTHHVSQSALLGLDDTSHTLNSEYAAVHTNPFLSTSYPHLATTTNYLSTLKSSNNSSSNLDEPLHQAKRRRLDFSAPESASLFYNPATGAAFL